MLATAALLQLATIQSYVVKSTPPVETVVSIVVEQKSISELILEYSKQYNVDPALALDVACAESCTRNKEGNVVFNPDAKNPNSTASGVFQFIKGTWQATCEGDVFDPAANVECGVRLLATTNGIRHWEDSRDKGFGNGWENKPYSKFNIQN